MLPRPCSRRISAETESIVTDDNIFQSFVHGQILHERGHYFLGTKAELDVSPYKPRLSVFMLLCTRTRTLTRRECSIGFYHPRAYNGVQTIVQLGKLAQHVACCSREAGIGNCLSTFSDRVLLGDSEFVSESVIVVTRHVMCVTIFYRLWIGCRLAMILSIERPHLVGTGAHGWRNVVHAWDCFHRLFPRFLCLLLFLEEQVRIVSCNRVSSVIGNIADRRT